MEAKHLSPQTDNPSVLFSSFTQGHLQLTNRVVLPPMCQWEAGDDGYPTAYHFAHYGSRAVGGVGMQILEATAVEARGRISPNDLGIWTDQQGETLAKLADCIKDLGSVPAMQLGHSGNKARPGTGRAVGPVGEAFSDRYEAPEELTAEGIDQVTEAFAEGARRASKAGFKALELHAAHGYLLHQFLSPIMNTRKDQFGGSTENRLRFPLEVIRRCRERISDSTTLMIRVSGSEYSERGYQMDEMIEMGQAFRDAGVEIIHVSSGGALPVAPPVYPGYQLELSRQLRQGTGLPTIAVGRLETPELAEFALREGYCDLVAVGRALMRDPNWAVGAALTLGDVPPVSDNLNKLFMPKT